MIFVIGITISILMFSVLTSMVLYYLPLMTIDTRKLWVINILILSLRHFTSLIEPVIYKLYPYADSSDISKIVNYIISGLIAILFGMYIHKRYSKEYKIKFKDKINETM